MISVFFKDHNGNVSSALIFRFVWHVLTIVAWGWYGYQGKIGPLEHLAFAASMAVGEGISYNWRRGQDRKLDASLLSGHERVMRVPDTDGGTPPERT